MNRERAWVIGAAVLIVGAISSSAYAGIPSGLVTGHGIASVPVSDIAVDPMLGFASASVGSTSTAAALRRLAKISGPAAVGRLVSMDVRSGQAVKAGELMARVDTAALAPILVRARAEVTQARAGDRVASAQLASVRAQARALDSIERKAHTARRNVNAAKAKAVRSYARGMEKLRGAQTVLVEAAGHLKAARAQIGTALKFARAELAAAEALPASDQQRAQRIADARGKLADLRAASSGLDRRSSQAASQLRAVSMGISAGRGAFAKGMGQIASAVSKIDAGLARIRRTRSQLRASERAAAAMVVVAEARVRVARVNVRIVEAVIDRAVIRAPFSGMVVDTAAEPGQLVFTGQRLLTLAESGMAQVDVDLSASDAASVLLGAPAKATVDGVADSFPGRVVHVAPQVAAAPTDALSDDIHLLHTVRVVVEVHDPSTRLKPGLPADVSISSYSKGQ